MFPVDIGQLEETCQRSGPVGDGRAKVVTGPRVAFRRTKTAQRMRNHNWHRYIHVLTGLRCVEANATASHLFQAELDCVGDSETRVAHNKNEGLEPRAVAGIAITGLDDPGHLVDGERKRGLEPELGRLAEHRWMLTNPVGPLAESKEGAESLEVLERVVGTVFPSTSEVTQIANT